MKINILTKELAGVTKYTGGVGAHYSSLARYLATSGHDVAVHLLAPQANLSVIESEPFQLVVLEPSPKVGGRLVGPIYDSIAFARAARSIPPSSVVLAPEWGGWASSIKLVRPDLKVATNLVTSLAQVRAIESRQISPRAAIKDRLQSALEKKQARRSDCIIAISRSILSWTENLWALPDVPKTVIPNFVDLAEIESVLTRAVKRTSGRPRVVFAGRLSKWKGVDTLTQAMQIVWQDFPDAELVLAGRVDMVDNLAADDYIRSLAHDFVSNVSILGHTGRYEVYEQLLQADVAVFPSRYEGFGIVALEAMAVGTAVITSSGSGFDDFCKPEENCLQFPPATPEMLARQLTRLLGQEALRIRLTAAARETVREYDVRNVAPALVKYLENL